MGIVIIILIILFCPLILLGAIGSAFVDVVLGYITIALILASIYLLLRAQKDPGLSKKFGALALLVFLVILIVRLVRALRWGLLNDAWLMILSPRAIEYIVVGIAKYYSLPGMLASTGALLLLFSLRETRSPISPILFWIGLGCSTFHMYLYYSFGSNISPLLLLYVAFLLGAYLHTFRHSVWRTDRSADRRLLLALPASFVLVAHGLFLYFGISGGRYILILDFAASAVLAWCLILAVLSLRSEKTEANRAE